jgi:ADP-ribose pyrophosphatase YjhB (NUDIX family)
VVGVGSIVVDAGRVLLVKRRNPPLQGRWSLPGGRVELGETLVEAVRREVLEECGLAVSVGPLVDVVDRIHRDEAGAGEHHIVLADYVCRCEVPAAAVAGSDAADLRWAEFGELADLGVAEATIDVIRHGLDLAMGAAPRVRPSPPA